MARRHCIAAALLALSSTALSTNTTTTTTMNITFSPPETPNCGQPSSSSSSSAITFSLHNTPTTSHCFNLNNTFTHPNDTTSGFTYTLTTLTPFPYLQTNYSQIHFSQPHATNLTLRTYNGLSCVQVATPEGRIQPWNDWTCSDTTSSSQCATLPYSVRSFEIGRATEEDKGEECVVGSAYGNASRSDAAGGGGRKVGLGRGVVMVLGASVWVSW